MPMYRDYCSSSAASHIPKRVALLAVGFLLMAGCATNPVTGRNELMLIPESMEIRMGQENYLPSRQMQGGDYVADPSVTTYIREVGQKMAAVSDRKLPYEFVVVNDSGINAWMLPGGKMGINRGLLLKMDNEAELAAVIGHEITHAAAKHSAKQMQQALLLQGAAVAASIAIEASTDNAFTRNAGVIGAQAATVLLQSKFSRDDESQADHYGMVYMSRAGYNPQAAVSVQELLLKASQGRPDNLFSRLLADHPPSADRVAANRAFAGQLPAGGETGKIVYHQRLARLFRSAPAYEAYDKGKVALKKGDYKAARVLADRAIGIEPKEALFHLLKGNALAGGSKNRSAVSEYRRATSLNPGYYASHLKLGLLLDSLGDRRQAQTELESSVRLLKTAPALYTLGRYARDAGDFASAKSYLKVAARDSGRDGRAAFADLLRFDLPAHAGEYLSARLFLNDRGQVDSIIQNNTPFPVGQIVVEIWSGGSRKRIALDRAIKGNAQSVFHSGMTGTQAQVDNAVITVISARLEK